VGAQGEQVLVESADWAPARQYRDQSAARQIGLGAEVRHQGDARATKRRVVQGLTVVGGEPTLDCHAHLGTTA